MGPLALLARCAAEFGIQAPVVGDGPIPVTVDLIRPSGALVRYSLELDIADRSEVRARERSPRRLPERCSERHINEDGWFCTHWAEGDPHPVLDLNAARGWWTLLLSYLERQEMASALRKWSGPTRAHGDAARHQCRAEQLATGFGIAFARDMRNGALRVVADRKRGRRRIELLRHGKRINRVSLPSGTLVNPRFPCPCDSADPRCRSIEECCVHGHELAQFIDALYRWRTLESRFISTLRDRREKCCGTLDICPLA
jgi:hypothetical protein